MRKETGDPAFPVSVPGHEGMTLRDYFAAKAMQALLARTTYHVEDYVSDIAFDSYSYADAMLAERAK